MLVNMLFPRRNMAVVAGLMFALGVGSYGRVFTTVHALESLLLAMLHLLVLYFFIRNDFRRDGRLRSPLFIAGLAIFLLSGLTRASSFSLLCCLLAYKAFFHRRRGRPVWSPDLLIFIIVGTVFYLGQAQWGFGQPTVFGGDGEQTYFSILSVKNLFRYLTLMFFPLQRSPMIETAPFWVAWLFEARTWIRFALTIAIVSYSFFGFVFGSRAIRFFIAWTYITLLPFTAHTEGGQWLNLNHLYLASLGFCVVIAAGAAGCSSLLARAGRRRYLPYLAPLLLAVVALGLTHQLDSKYKAIARWPESQQLREQVSHACSPGGGDRMPGAPPAATLNRARRFVRTRFRRYLWAGEPDHAAPVFGGRPPFPRRKTGHGEVQDRLDARRRRGRRRDGRHAHRAGRLGFDAEYIPGDIGWEIWCREANALPDRTLEMLRNVDAALFGAITSKPKEEAEPS
jgi:hypothetical protein